MNNKPTFPLLFLLLDMNLLPPPIFFLAILLLHNEHISNSRKTVTDSVVLKLSTFEVFLIIIIMAYYVSVIYGLHYLIGRNLK